MAASWIYNIIGIIVIGLTGTDMGFVADVTKGEDTLDCFIDRATECYTSRRDQFNETFTKFSENKRNTDSLKPICLTQIRSDKHGECFDDATNLCREEEAAAIKSEWDQLNSEITDTCKAVCPNLLDIIDCKNMTDSSGIQASRFETFCRTFNMSLICAKEVLGDCQFGMQIYSDILDYKLRQYWKHICNSGCTNIDATIGVLITCDKHLKDSSEPRLCARHSRFKDCVLDSPVVCDKVMTLVRIKYRQYDRNERACTTTTTSSTVATTTTTTSTTSSIAATSRSNSIPNATMPSTTASTTSSTSSSLNLSPIPSTSATPKDSPLDIDSCLPHVTTALSDTSALNTEDVMLVLQFESCLHNLTDDNRVIDDAIRTLPVTFKGFYHHVKQNGWQLLANTMSHCKPKHIAATSGCSGHSYGLIPCSSAPRSVQAIVLHTFLYTGLSILIYQNQHV